MIHLSLLTLWVVVMSSAPLTASAEDRRVPSYSLPDVVSLALERNPALSGARGAVEETLGRETAARAYPNPSITGYTGYGALKDAGLSAANSVVEAPREHLWEYNFTVGQPLEWPSMRAARRQAAEAGVAGATAGRDEIQLNLIADVHIAFYELLIAQRNLELARQNIDIVEDVQRIVNTRVRLGEAPQFESIKAEVELLKAKQVVRRSENTVRVNRVILDTLTAGALGREFIISGSFRKFPRELTVDALSERVAQHPAIRRSAHLVEQADRTLQFQREARVPTVTLNGSYFREIGREAVLGGVSVPTPIWYRRQGEIATALGSKRREEAEWLRVRNDLLRRVNQHYQDALTTADLISVFEQGLLKQAQEALRIAEFSFRQGAASLLDVLDAQRVQRQILVDYAQAQFELSVALSQLERAVGTNL